MVCPCSQEGAAGDEEVEKLFTADELEAYLADLFKDSDSDGNGWLDPQEFKEIMIAADIGLSEDQIYEVMLIADENGDGKIEYAEFVPVAAEIIQALQARQDMEAKEEEMLEDAEFAAEMYMQRGLTQVLPAASPCVALGWRRYGQNMEEGYAVAGVGELTCGRAAPHTASH